MEQRILNRINTNNICRELMKDTHDKTYLISMIFQACLKKRYIEENDYNKNIIEEVGLNYNFSNHNHERIEEMLNEFSYEELKNITKYLIRDYDASYDFRESPITQSNELNNLVIDLLKINKEDDKIFDFGFGEGNFLFSLLDRVEEDGIKIKSISGCEILHRLYWMTKMTFAILNYKNVDINLVDCDGLKEKSFDFNKGFVFPPFCVKGFNEGYKSSLDENIVFSSRVSNEWLFIDKMLTSSKDFERVVTILHPRCLYNIADDNYKRMLIKNGLIEGIIELPNNLFGGTTIKTYIVVFSKNNKEIKYVDASNMIEEQERKGLKVVLDNKKIFDAFNSNDVKKVNNQELLKKDDLNLTRFSNVEVNFKKAATLSSVAEVFTGSQYTLKNFEKYLCNNEKECTYKLIASNDIDEYTVNWDGLNMINNDDQKLEKFAVQKNDVIITSKSSKVKIAVVDFDPKIKCIVTGGMLIVRPDVTKLNPFYLKLFLESDVGAEILKSIQKGGGYIVTITGNNLANIKINLLDIDKQNEIADKYVDKLSSLLAYKQLISDIETSLGNLYQDECED